MSVAKYFSCNITYRHALHAAQAIDTAHTNGKSYARYMLGDLMMRMRCANIFGDEWWPPCPMDTNQYRSALVLLGNIGMGTAIHVDWSEAINLALAITGMCDMGKALALWMFVRPSAMEELQELMMAKVNGLSSKYPEGFKTANLPMFTVADMQHIFRTMGKDKVHLVEQHAGEVVRVCAGWGHAVVNLQPCIKIAYDRYVVANFPHYAVCHAMNASLFGENHADDYTGWADVRFWVRIWFLVCAFVRPLMRSYIKCNMLLLLLLLLQVAINYLHHVR